jgi:hypothetical protein
MENIDLKGFDIMPEEATVDCTEELVRPCEVTDGSCKCEAPESRNLNELISMSINDMTKGEIEYLISALKVKAEETDKIAQRAFEENRKLREARAKDLRTMEDTLTFIKSITANNYNAICLAIKSMQMEVK